MVTGGAVVLISTGQTGQIGHIYPICPICPVEKLFLLAIRLP
jgi:hypothetical protein